MGTAIQTKPMKISFNNAEEREQFIRWAENEEKDNSPEMKKVRKQLDEIRRLRRMRAKADGE